MEVSKSLMAVEVKKLPDIRELNLVDDSEGNAGVNCLSSSLNSSFRVTKEHRMLVLSVPIALDALILPCVGDQHRWDHRDAANSYWPDYASG